MQVRLTRIASNPEFGTFGTLVVDGKPICLTLEPYSRDNETNISSIPNGQYICKKIVSPSYGETFEVTNIQGRSSILFHWGNLDTNTEGCILLGEEYGELSGQWAVLSSKKAFVEFMGYMQDIDAFTLTIIEAY